MTRCVGEWILVTEATEGQMETFGGASRASTPGSIHSQKLAKAAKGEKSPRNEERSSPHPISFPFFLSVKTKIIQLFANFAAFCRPQSA
jgi:hypothetical protein